MPSLLVVSPHLDDAAFSYAEPMLALRRAGWRVHVATVFTATVAAPTGFALACQTDKGIDPKVDYMASRRAEDRDFLQRLGLEGHHLDLAEAPHRGYASAVELFGTVHDDDPAFERCERVLGELLDELRPDVCMGPLGVGRHVDHRVVVASLARVLAGSGTKTILHYADQPYALKHPDEVDEAVRALASATLLHFRSDAALRHEAIDAIGAYTTQLGFQFGGEVRMRETLGTAMADGTRCWLRGARRDALDPFLHSPSSTDQAS